MQIVLYDALTILDVIKGANGIVITDNDIIWREGKLGEVKAFYAIIDDSLDTATMTLDEIKVADSSIAYKKISVEEEMQKLREENEMNSLAIMELTELMFGV